MKKKAFMKINKTNISVVFASLMSIVWFILGFTEYGQMIEKNVSDSWLSLIHAMTFIGMIGGFWVSLMIWLEEVIDSEKII